MPSVQTMTSRKSSITNAFVNSLIPVVEPSVDDIEEALRILGMSAADVRCAYCGDPSTEWDHLRPLVVNRRPTGYISEIGNLVPACGKCNQSKGNKNWLAWMMSRAPRSPATRKVPELAQRVARLKAYEAWRPSVAIEFEKIVGTDAYCEYWGKLDAVIEAMRGAQGYAETLRQKIAAAHGASDSRDAVEREVLETSFDDAESPND
ncbi:MAG TPA: HNH endonuclease [Tepidisphaeraceae bacterium]|nr:HNH endonuclease [Tepidisphaeraceae bacterium]